MTTPGPTYDAALHLLDRQIIDHDGRLLAKVDDLELTEDDDGRLLVTALLTGPGALGPRIGGRLGRWTVAIWSRLRPDADPRPGRIEIRDVASIDSAVRLGPASDPPPQGLERWLNQHVITLIPGADAGEGPSPATTPATSPGRPSPGGRRHRLGDLLGSPVDIAGRDEPSHVNDVRLGRSDDGLVIAGLIVSDRHAGSLLGYDRRREQGPLLVAAAVRRLHTRAAYAPWPDVRSISWRSTGPERAPTRVQVSRVQPLSAST